MRGFRIFIFSIAIVGFSVYASCSVMTHVDEYEVMPPDIESCMKQDFNLNLSEQCAYCRCTTCTSEIIGCGLRCWEIVACAILNRCDQADAPSCVAEKCAPLLNRQQSGVEQASALAVCISSCNDVCLQR
ncbi:MAG: hypothetical protein JXA30_08175 [Deltaproteobacteria bacterium]|nr:hypothetical protein [Deltaproteobacteria bacterium]